MGVGGEGDYLKMGGYHINVFLEIPHDAAWEKDLDVLFFFLLTNMCYKIIAQIKFEMIGIHVSIIHANSKNSA